MAQVTPFKKSVLDSLKANEFNGSFSYALNLGQDGTSTFTTNTDVGILYSNRRSDYELVGNGYRNRFEANSISNRLFVLAKVAMFSHVMEDAKIKEKKVYFEPFTLYVFDANRGINYRWQWGINGVYALKPTRFVRIKVGMGLLYEFENWQMIKPENLYLLDSISQEEKNYLFDTVGINAKGQLFRNNVRLNLYANFVCLFAKNISLNTYLNIQQPFVPPYHNLPPDPRFPVVTKLYPRITIDAHLSIHVVGKFSFITDFILQYDKGQIPLYVPNFVYSITQGVGFDF